MNIDFINLKNEILQVVQRLITTALLHQKTFNGFKNKHKGQTVILIGAGPTLNYFEPIKNAIYVGANRTFLYKDVDFDYLFTIDKAGLETKSEDYYEQFFAYRPNHCIKFVGDQNLGEMYQISESKISDSNARRYKTTAGNLISKFTFDIESEALGNFCSVALQAIQFILYTNPSKIYLVGIDCNVSRFGHFTGATNKLSNERNEDLDSNTFQCIKAWSELKNFLKIYYPDTQIISVNPVGLKGIFDEVYTEKYLYSNDKLRFDNDFREFMMYPTKHYLQKIMFTKQFEDLVNKLQNKKVIIYGTGALFQSVCNMFDLRKLNIISVSDKKYLSEEEFFGYKAIPPKMIFDIGADCILVAVQEYERIIEDFKQKAPDYMEIIPLARKFEGIK